jgi:Kef-type K+ transport system membrane component KefB
MHSGILLLFGIGIVGGLVSALMAQKVKIPQVLGYIIAGLILGESGFKVVTIADINGLGSFNNFALGIIGFLVGSELKFDTLKKYAPQFSLLLAAEGVLAFTLVLLGTGSVIYFVTGSFAIAASGGIILGAIASATDPASTISVLWEQRSAGILTTTIVAVIALDDALAMVLYGVGSGVAQILMGGEDVSLLGEMGKVGFELGSSVLIGVVGGYLVAYIMKKSKKAEQAVALSLGIVLLSIGLAVNFNLDIIIVAMTVGVILANTVPIRSEELIGFFKTISLPIYAIFFVLIGARISIGSMPAWLWGVVVSYVVLRSIGKYFGAYAGAKISKADPLVVKYAGLGLFAQGGVAIGLSIVASHHFEKVVVTDSLMLSDVIVFTVATTTLFVQIIGPFAVKLATKLSGEAGRDLTEEDIIAGKTVNSCISSIIPTVEPRATLQNLLTVLTKTDALFVPVVDNNRKFYGTVSLSEVKDTFLDPDCWEWMIVSDIINSNGESLSASLPLEDGIRQLAQLHTDQLAVEKDGYFQGILDTRVVQAMIRSEMVSLRSGAN